MNRRELEVKAKYEKEGYIMLRGGAPDFIAIKPDGNGGIAMRNDGTPECKGVEVKPESNFRLRYEQEIFRKILQLASIEYKVEVVK